MLHARFVSLPCCSPPAHQAGHANILREPLQRCGAGSGTTLGFVCWRLQGSTGNRASNANRQPCAESLFCDAPSSVQEMVNGDMGPALVRATLITAGSSMTLVLLFDCRFGFDFGFATWVLRLWFAT